MSSNYDRLEALGIELKGRRFGQFKTKCPRCTETRKNKSDRSLSVNITSGRYNCKNSPCDFKGSVGDEDRKNKKEEKTYTRPNVQSSNVTQLSDPLVQWFKNVRGISQQTLITAKVGEGMHWMYANDKIGRPAGQVPCIQFPYFRNNELINIKYRSEDKCFMMETGAELIFFNLDACADPQDEEVIIVEGEIDALSWIEAGYPFVISVPNGASRGKNDMTYLDNCLDFFEFIEKIV